MANADRVLTGAGSAGQPVVSLRAAFLAASGLAALFTLQNALSPVQRMPRSPGGILAVQLITWYAWLLLLPLIVRAVSRVRAGTAVSDGEGVRQAVFAFIIALLHGVIAGFARWLFGLSVTRDLGVVMANAPVQTFASDFIRYLLIAGALHVMAYYRALRERDVREAHIATNLARARLDLLQSKLQPHFLFNTLNSIAALIRDQPNVAEQTVGRLADLLRATLYMGESAEIPIEQEIDLLQKYVAIEQLRFNDRLTVTIDVPRSLNGSLVPHLLLQPLVENAIRHGVGPREAHGTVTVSARSIDSRLVLRVEDDGVGMSATRNDGRGIGQSATRERLQHMYGDAQQFNVESRAGGGTVVAIELPLHDKALS